MDTVAEVLSWVVLIVVPAAGIYLFWQLHILPERIAEKRRHPQLELIKTLCLLSLAFGGILWPLAWIIAYSKPVLHRLAYGDEETETPSELQQELDAMRRRLSELEARHEEPH
jgi:hypothetical protein